jgi:hypothetical protein
VQKTGASCLGRSYTQAAHVSRGFLPRFASGAQQRWKASVKLIVSRCEPTLIATPPAVDPASNRSAGHDHERAPGSMELCELVARSPEHVVAQLIKLVGDDARSELDD